MFVYLIYLNSDALYGKYTTRKKHVQHQIFATRPFVRITGGPFSLHPLDYHQGMLEVDVFEWPKFDVKHQGVFEEFAQQVNNAVGYTLSEVTLRGLSETDDSTVDPQRFSKWAFGRWDRKEDDNEKEKTPRSG